MVISVHVEPRLYFVYRLLKDSYLKRRSFVVYGCFSRVMLLFIGFLRFQAPPLPLSPWKHQTKEITSHILSSQLLA